MSSAFDREYLDRLERMVCLLSEMVAGLPGAVRDLHALTAEVRAMRERWPDSAGAGECGG